MTSEALKNTVYIIHATLINTSNFYYVKFIIKFVGIIDNLNLYTTFYLRNGGTRITKSAAQTN